MSSPAVCPVNGIYFATHFGNWYANAPVAEVCDYIAELAQRGTNHLMLWFDISNFHDFNDTGAQRLLARMRQFTDQAHSVGMKVGLVRVTNEAWRNSPVELRADPTGGRGAIMLTDLCPSLPAARQLIERTSAEIFGLFDQLDFICLWPYDSGGCGCAGCRPWPSNGYLVASEIVAQQFRKRFPEGQIILSTWFMYRNEWQEIRKRIEAGQFNWVDAIMAEEFADGLPADLEHGDTPRGLPLLGFPEISMVGMSPWGGCGATPRPEACRRKWGAVGAHMAGGFPYSEGIYEDVNKAIYTGFYRDRHRSADDILGEYVAREFSPAVVVQGVEMLKLMETTHNRTGLDVRDLSAADRVWELASEIQQALRPEVAAHWRWQVLYLRARIDSLLKANAGRVTDELRATFAKVHAVYHTDEMTMLNALLPPLPPQKTAPDPGNLAAHCPVVVSSTHPQHPSSATMLVDDVVAAFDPDNFWCSANDDLTPTVTIDLGREARLADVQLQFRAGNTYRFIPTWVSVEVSRDGKNYAPVLTRSNDVPVPGQGYKQWFYSYPIQKPARFVKMILGASSETAAPYTGCVQLAEVRVHREAR